jgi:hypothetical protein
VSCQDRDPGDSPTPRSVSTSGGRRGILNSASPGVSARTEEESPGNGFDSSPGQRRDCRTSADDRAAKSPAPRRSSGTGPGTPEGLQALHRLLRLLSRADVGGDPRDARRGSRRPTGERQDICVRARRRPTRWTDVAPRSRGADTFQIPQGVSGKGDLRSTPGPHLVCGWSTPGPQPLHRCGALAHHPRSAAWSRIHAGTASGAVASGTVPTGRGNEAPLTCIIAGQGHVDHRGG